MKPRKWTWRSEIAYRLLYGIWYTLSLLPMWVHYLFSDLLYLLIAYVVRYREAIVMKNLRASFPEKDEAELKRIKRGFYRFFCDYIAETVKYTTMSKRQVLKRMQFRDTEPIFEAIRQGKSIALMLGHYCNWEFVPSLMLWMDNMSNATFGHIYHPLENPVFDRLFLTFRNRMGSQSVSMAETFRWNIKHRNEGKSTMMGYISDQVPVWHNIHHWTTFLNQETPVMTGCERIARRLHQAVVYVDMERVARGKYVATFRWITEDAANEPEFSVTDRYFEMLEQTIRQAPQYWLWSHNRWKRSREEFDRKFVEVNGRVIERKD